MCKTVCLKTKLILFRRREIRLGFLNIRNSGNSKIGFTKKFSEAFDALTGFSSAPLRLSSIFGLMISIISFLYGMYILSYSFYNDIAVPGYLSTFLSIIFLGGIQLLFIGLLSEYVARLFVSIKKRPHYIIDNSVGFKKNKNLNN